MAVLPATAWVIVLGLIGLGLVGWAIGGFIVAFILGRVQRRTASLAAERGSCSRSDRPS
jgi:hypothetical protein